MSTNPKRTRNNNKNTNNNNNNNSNSIDSKKKLIKEEVEELAKSVKSQDIQLSDSDAMKIAKQIKKYQDEDKKQAARYDRENQRLRTNPSAVLEDQYRRAPENLRSELDTLKSELSRLKSRQTDAPLAAVGAGLSSAAAKSIRMLVDPIDNETVPLPGDYPGSLVKSADLVATSVDLDEGKGSVIATPYGKYQTYVSGYDAVIYEAEEATGWAAPQLRALGVRQGQTVNAYIVEPVANSGFVGTSLNKIMTNDSASAYANQNDYFLIECTSNGVGGVTSHCNMVDLTGNGYGYLDVFTLNLATNVQTFNPITLSGDFHVHVGFVGDGSNVDQSILLPAPVPANTLQQTRIFTRFRYAQNVNIESGERENYYNSNYDSFGLQNVPVKFYVTKEYQPQAGRMFYSGYTLTSMVQIGQGGYASGGKFLAMSCLISDDASKLNDAGNIVATSFPHNVISDTGADVIKYASSRTMWNYIGQLRKGAYQIYVPDLVAQASVDHASVNPWTTPNLNTKYNMAFYYDYSVSNQQIPSKLPIRVRTCGVYLAPKLSTFTPAVVYPQDSSYLTALSLLRLYYNPCCNPDHKDHISSWLKNTFQGVFNHAKSFIREYGPSIVDGTSKILQAAAPLAISAIAAL